MKYLIFLCMILFLCGCASTTPPVPSPIKFEKTEKYSVQEDLNKIVKPTPIEPIYVKLNNNVLTVVPKSQATHILLNPTEYAKIGAVVKLAGTYKTIILEQENLVNLHINEINVLKELLELERQKAIDYRELWLNYQKMYESERWDHKVDNFVNRGVIGLMGAGIILLIAL